MGPKPHRTPLRISKVGRDLSNQMHLLRSRLSTGTCHPRVFPLQLRGVVPSTRALPPKRMRIACDHHLTLDDGSLLQRQTQATMTLMRQQHAKIQRLLPHGRRQGTMYLLQGNRRRSRVRQSYRPCRECLGQRVPPTYSDLANWTLIWTEMT